MLNQILMKSALAALVIALVYGVIYASGVLTLIGIITNALSPLS